MLRAIAGAVVGYVVMAVVVMVTFAIAWMVLGMDGAFREGSYEVTTAWLTTSFVLSLIAALVGGAVCALIAKRGSKAPIALSIVVLFLGAIAAVYEVSSGREQKPLERTEEVTMMEASQNAQQPTIALILNPIVGAVGVFAGASLTRRKRVVETSAAAPAS
jgi:hypothetical protein